MNARIETLTQKNDRLNQEAHNSKTDYVKIIITFLLALIIGFVLAKLFDIFTL